MLAAKLENSTIKDNDDTKGIIPESNLLYAVHEKLYWGDMKKIYVTVVAVILVVVAAMLIAPTDYAVKRQVDINKPDTVVFSFLKLLKNQDEFSVWARMDPAMKKSYAGEDGTVGFISAWESDDENVGSGEQEIMAIEEGKRIDYELRFIKPYEATGKAYMEIEPLSADSTRVTWGFEGQMPRPMNIMLLFLDMERQMAPALEDGLNNLKNKLQG